MKKAFVLVLALVLTMGLALPAAAAGSPEAPVINDTTTAPLPEVVETTVTTETGVTVVVELVAADDVKLTETEVKTLEEADKTLDQEVPEGMVVQYFFYVGLNVIGENKGEDAEQAPISVDTTVKILGVNEVVVKQFVDGKWVELEVVNNGDGTFTIKGVVEGPLAIFTK